MPAILKLDTPIDTTIGNILDFFGVMANKWGPAFEVSIKRDGATRYDHERFMEWLNKNYTEFNWGCLFRKERCQAKVKGGKRKGLPCKNNAMRYKKDVIIPHENYKENYKKTINEEDVYVIIHKKGETINGFCEFHQNLVKKVIDNPDLAVQDKMEFIFNGDDIPMKCRSSLAARNENKRILPVPAYDNNPTDNDYKEFIKGMSEQMLNISKKMDMMIMRQDGMRKRLDKIDSSYNKKQEDEIQKNRIKLNKEYVENGEYEKYVEKGSIVDVFNCKVDIIDALKNGNKDGKLIKSDNTIMDMYKERHVGYIPKKSKNEIAADFNKDSMDSVCKKIETSENMNEELKKMEAYRQEINKIVNLVSKEDIEREKRMIKEKGGPSKYDTMEDEEFFKDMDAMDYIDSQADRREVDEDDRKHAQKVMRDSKIGKLRNPLMSPDSDPIQNKYGKMAVIKRDGKEYTYSQLFDVYFRYMTCMDKLRYAKEDSELTDEQLKTYEKLYSICEEDILDINSMFGRRPKSVYKLRQLSEKLSTSITKMDYYMKNTDLKTLEIIKKL